MTESGKPAAGGGSKAKPSARKAAVDKLTAKRAAAKKTAPAKKKAVADGFTKKTTTPATGTPPSAADGGSRLSATRDLARSAPMSKYFASARKRARKMIDDPDALKRVADESFSSAAARSGPFAAVMDDFRTVVRLVVAYARGNYREIGADSLALVVAGLVYVVSPIDLIPDAIPVIGFADDAAVIGWVIKSVREELDAFRAWELGREPSSE